MNSMNTRKIIFINRFYSPDISATAQILTDIAGGVSHVYPVDIICSRYSYDSLSKYPSYEKRDAVQIYRVLSTNFGRHMNVFRAFDYVTFGIFALIKLVCLSCRSSVVVVKTDPPLLIVLVALVKRIKGFKLISWNQDIFPEVAKDLFIKNKATQNNNKDKRSFSPFHSLRNKLGSGLYSLLLLMRNISWKQVDKQVVISKTMAAYVNNVLHNSMALEAKDKKTAERIVPQSAEDFNRPLQMTNMALIPNHGKGLIEKERFDSQEIERFRHRYLPNEYRDAMVVAYSGNLGYVHDWHTMAETIFLLHDNREIFFIMQGGGKGYQKMKAYANKRGLKNVLFTHYCPLNELKMFMLMADIHWLSLSSKMNSFVFPSKLASMCAAQKTILYIGDRQDEIALLLNAYGISSTFNCGESDQISEWIRHTITHSRKGDLKQATDNNEALNSMPTPQLSCSKAGQIYDDWFSLDSTIKLWLNLLHDVTGENIESK